MVSRHDLDSAKERLRIPELWRILNLPGEPRKSCRSPFREDRRPSFSVYDEGRRAKDFSTGENFDAIAFFAKAQGLSKSEAIRRFVELATARPEALEPIIYHSKPAEVERKLDLTGFCIAKPFQVNAIAGSRGIDVRAVLLAQKMETVAIGWVCGFSSWILTDSSRMCAEARRIDREPFPATPKLGIRKAHTIAGSKKNWPVGVLPSIKYREFELIGMVEGGPDYLALLHFAIRQNRKGILPVAMLGRAQGLRGIHRASLEYFRNKRVRIYPHDDQDARSYDAAARWARELRLMDARVDFFTFEGITKSNGGRCKDLNDCVAAAERFQTRLEALFP